MNYGYDAVGNLTKKSDFSANTANAYVYTGGSCGGDANAVKSVSLAAGGSRTYCYDANGNLTSDSAGLAIAYDHQNLPTKATRGSQTDWFRYGADGQRTRSWGSDGARVYLPGYEHRTDTGETKVYVGDYAVISKTGSTRKVEYLLKDRLGSVDAVASSAGAITETRGYDAFGKPRDGSWNDVTPAKIASTAVTPKGFTQHEHLNQLELIHMNGRVYDYGLGRFTGVDPFIQFPLNSQSINPYSYILNNPLSGTDPTGYATCQLTDGKGCLEDGKNTIVDGGGNKIGTITIGSKTVDFRPNFSGIAKSLGSNGAGTLGSMLRAQGNELASKIGSAVGRIAIPSGADLQQRGERGSALDFISGFSMQRNNASIDALNFGGNYGVPGLLYRMATGEDLFQIPTFELSNKELEGAFAFDVLNLLAIAVQPARSLARSGVPELPYHVQTAGPSLRGSTSWKFGPNDLDFRGSGRGLRDALDAAFERTGLSRSEFEVAKWGRNVNGKSFPVEWRHPSGAEVNIDLAHTKNGPRVPHVGYQTGGKRGGGGAVRGHILLDDVPYNR